MGGLAAEWKGMGPGIRSWRQRCLDGHTGGVRHAPTVRVMLWWIRSASLHVATTLGMHLPITTILV